jgi:TonB family protein
MNAYEQLLKGRYGSFELKNSIGPNLLKGLLVSFLIHSVAVASPFLLRLFWSENDQPVTRDVIIIMDKPPMRPAEKQVPVIHPDRSKAPAKYGELIPVDSIENSDDEILPADQKTLGRYFSDTGSSGNSEGTGGVVEIRKQDFEEQIPPPDSFIVVEVMPQALPDFSPQPKYPEIALISKLSGKVFVKAYVDKRGNVKKWQFLKVDPPEMGFDDEVAKVVPQWKFSPAIQQGRVIGVWVSIPFNFRIK